MTAPELTQKREKCDMFKHSENRQVLYSLNALAEALFDLMQKEGFEEITVTQICQTAGITRRTFYRNCDSKLDLIDFLTEKYVRNLLDSVDFTCTDALLLYRNFFQYWKEHSTFLRALYQNRLFPWFSRTFTTCCIRWMEDGLMLDMLKGRPNRETLRLFYNSFLIGGLCSVLEPWTAEDFQTSTQELAYVLASLAPERVSLHFTDVIS